MGLRRGCGDEIDTDGILKDGPRPDSWGNKYTKVSARSSHSSGTWSPSMKGPAPASRPLCSSRKQISVGNSLLFKTKSNHGSTLITVE